MFSGIDKFLKLLEAASDEQARIAEFLRGSELTMPLYHGSQTEFTEFQRPASGVFFSPHQDWASVYGPVIKTCYVWAPKVYQVSYCEPLGEAILDALFDRDYDALAKYVQQLKAQGYYALQTSTDSEMVCAFDNAKIYCPEAE